MAYGLGGSMTPKIAIHAVTVAILVNVSVVASKRPTPFNPRPVPAAHAPHPVRPPTTQRIFAPLPSGIWTDADVILNNNSPKQLTVTPTLYRGGIGSAGKSVALRPSEVRWVKLSEFNEPTRRELATNDGLELSYQGHMLELGAQVLLLRAKGKGSVDVPFSSIAEYRSAVQEAVWPAPAGARAVVALGNASDTTV